MHVTGVQSEPASFLGGLYPAQRLNARIENPQQRFGPCALAISRYV